MKRTLIFMAALVGLSSAANAAVSVVIAPDSATYNVSDVITLTVTATADAGETSPAVFGDILMDQPSLVSGGGVTPQALESFGGAITWVLGTNPCDSTRCTLMNQIGGLGALAVTNTPLQIATATFLAAAPGVVNVTWDSTTFDFFGLFGGTTPAGTSFTIVPEPTTAAMLCLGLLGLATAGRRRS